MLHAKPMAKPLAIDLFCGLGGWAEGFLAEGYDVIGFDIERHRYPRRVIPDADVKNVGGPCSNAHRCGVQGMRDAHKNYGVLDGWAEYPAQLVLQDVLTLHGSQFKDAAVIVASPPCTEYSYMAMPWARSKQIALAIRNNSRCTGMRSADFPDGYTGSRNTMQLNRLWDACFRIQWEASEAAGRYIPMVVENVKGAQPWVGRARWHYGSFYLWGDVPALMPHSFRATKLPAGNSVQQLFRLRGFTTTVNP